MKLQVLLSAMFLEDYSYLNTLHITSDAVVINQCDREGIEEIRNGKQTVRFINSKERGLSKSRNRAIDESDADICILCDNDVRYVDHYDSLILQAFEENEDADILIFFIKRPERQVPVFDKTTDMNYLTVMKIFSPEIAFRRKSIQGLRFLEMFGAGAKYAMGEENIFLYEALRKKRKVRYIPVMIAELIETESTWFQGYTDKFFRDRGANFYAMTSRFYWLLILQFAIRKRKLYQNDNHMLHAIEVMFQGEKEYKNEIISNRR